MWNEKKKITKTNQMSEKNRLFLVVYMQIKNKINFAEISIFSTEYTSRLFNVKF